MAVARERHAALEERERLVERQVAVLELLDDGFELRDGGLEVLDGIGHYDPCSTRQGSSPSASVTRTRSPGRTDAADRMIPVRASFQHTA